MQFVVLPHGRILSLRSAYLGLMLAVIHACRLVSYCALVLLRFSFGFGFVFALALFGFCSVGLIGCLLVLAGGVSYCLNLPLVHCLGLTLETYKREKGCRQSMRGKGEG